jgi:hypothetical protein
MKQATILTKSLLQTLLFGVTSAKWIKFKVATIALIAFDFLFHHDRLLILGPGINLMLFSILLVISSYIIHKKSINDKVYLWSGFALILTSINIMYNRTDWAIITYVISLFSLIGSLYNNRAHNIIITLAQSFVLQFAHPFNTAYKLLLINTDGLKQYHFKKIGPYVLLPLALVSMFALLYSLTNQALATFFQGFTFDGSLFLSFFTPSRVILWIIFFFIFGVFFVTALDKTIIPYGKYVKKLHREEMKKSGVAHAILGLTQELKMATISFIALNSLLAVVLLTDVFTFFSSSMQFSATELSKMVHSGTYIVTFTIALSSALVMIFFRKNLNFHPHKAKLIKLAKLWLGLNSLYVMMVGIKNAMYIFDYGLTFKRMSVIIFLASCMAMLIFSFLKIDKKWSIAYFINRLLASVCIIVLMFSFIDHKAAIVKFSAVVQSENVDAGYLSRLCRDRQLLLYNNMNKIEEKTTIPLFFYSKTYRKTIATNWKSSNYISNLENNFYKTETYKNLNHFKNRY